MKIKSKIFGAVDIGEEYWEEHEITLNGRDFTCVLTTFWEDEATSEDEKLALRVGNLLDRLAGLDVAARAELLARYHKGDDIKESYIIHHFEDCGEECAAQIAQKLGTKEHDHLLFLSKLELNSVSPGFEERLVLTCDYTIGMDITQYLLVVKFDEQGNILGVDVES